MYKKRQHQRLYARIKERHWNVEQFLQALNKPPTTNIPVLLHAREFFVKYLQSVLDFMFDVSKKTLKGESEFAQFSLTYLCVNEFMCAFHLLEHHYATQAYTHIRTVYEILDKIELFYKQPKWAELWASDDEKRKIAELSPSAVRKKLGKPKYDSIYAFFSSLGPHGTFRSVQTTGGMRKERSEKGNPRITLWIGGTKFEHHLIGATMSISHTLKLLLFEIIKIYANDINIDESKEVMNSAIKDYKELLVKYFIPWAKENKLDTSEIANLINKEQLCNF